MTDDKSLQPTQKLEVSATTEVRKGVYAKYKVSILTT